jgi:hypothetical protein
MSLVLSLLCQSPQPGHEQRKGLGLRLLLQPLHQAHIEAQVVHRRQPLGQPIPDLKEVVQVAARIVRAAGTVTVL